MNAIYPRIQRPLSVAVYMHDLGGGGVERQTLTLATELMGLGAIVTLILHRMEGELLSQVPAELRMVDLKAARTLQDIPRLADWLRRERPDILLANLDHNNVAALLARAWARVPSRVVISQHNVIAGYAASNDAWTSRYIPTGYRVLSPWISKAVAVSAGVADELNRLAGLPLRKISVIHNPVIGGDFAARSQMTVDHPWLQPREHAVFVTAGRLVPQKDHETLIRAFALHRRRKPSKLLILGNGDLRAVLEALANELGVADAVDFLGFQANPLPYFRLADAFVLSSRSEGFGNVLVEAMGCGTPVISTDCPHGPSEILDGGRYGALVPTSDPVAMAAAMDDIEALRSRCPPAVLRGRAAAFTVAGAAARYDALFRDLVHGSRVIA
jgi:glycosyltransferase involved in cell wall biosynthesis